TADPRPPATGDHAATGTLEIIGVRGLPRFVKGDDLAVAIAGAAPDLRDDLVLLSVDLRRRGR
ncbi:MAG: hypothetical protein NT049_06275, partial [Planctomycetota bacterium]|nr:hypothetical protein [Planctomycetota bacterium]